MTTSLFKPLIISLFMFFIPLQVFSSNYEFKGLSKLSNSDLQVLSSVDITSKILNENDINTLIKDLYSSDLIYDVTYESNNNEFIITIIENSLIEQIYFNGNIIIKDEVISSGLKSKINYFLKKDLITRDIKYITNVYTSLGYNEVSVTVSTEKFSNDRVNLILDINEGKQSQIVDINFLGNLTFSDSFLNTLITSKSQKFYNIFSSGSNFNIEVFKFDNNKLTSFYEDKGFFDARISYSIENLSKSKYILNFFIDEGLRYKIENIDYSYAFNIKNSKFDILEKRFKKKLSNNNFYFDINLIQQHINDLDDLLNQIGSLSNNFKYDYSNENNSSRLLISEVDSNTQMINKITIIGNSITKDATIRDKLIFEPGDYYNETIINRTKKDLLQLKYINNVNITKTKKDNKYDIDINVNENKKSGNFLLGGNFSGDTGLGFGITLKDFNLFGTGNEIDSTFNINAERAFFKVNYTTPSNKFKTLKNTYSIFNQDTDLTSSFGYKVKKTGLGYTARLRYDENSSISSGIKYEQLNGYSASNNELHVTDNIGEFDNFSFEISIKRNTTNDYLYPTNGSANKIVLNYSPNEISDDPFYQLLLENSIYFQRKHRKSFFFTSNNIGIAESLDGKLKTINAFSLGGLNFKGYDFRGIGPFDNRIYLGGNKYFTSTIGYGSSFIFDEKDNVNIKLFLTTGSIWDSDYTANNNFELRSSFGLSFDILTAVGPLSLSYALPIEKNNNDKVQEFNFTIGTAF